jgi:hypothetical protein
MKHIETLNLVQEEDKEVSAVKEFTRLQAELGEVALPKMKSYSKGELKELVSDVVKQECQSGNGCFSPLLVFALIDKESGWKTDAIYLEKTLIGKKFKDLEGEGPLSKALGPFSFGLAQVNWGWHKNTCSDLLLDSAKGDKSALYPQLLDPKNGVRCALRVLKEKWDGAKGKPNRLMETLSRYNGGNMDYARDVSQRLVKMAEQEMKEG